MSIKVGGIDLAASAVDSEFRIAILEQIVEKLINKAAPGTVTQQDIDKFKSIALQKLQKKYPEAGINPLEK